MLLLGIKDAAKEIGLSVHELRKGAKEGRYPVHYSGTKFLFNVEMVEAVIKAQMYANQEEARKCLMS